MNALFLVAAMVVVFVFGYRFYAKLLALDIFRLDKNYSTPAQSRADAREYVPTHPHLLFGHHLAAAAGATLLAAPMAAAAWGWVPAFLWITIGSAVAAGTYGLGGFWLSLRHPKGWRQLAADLAGPHTRLALFLFALIALVILLAASAGLTAAVLSAYPGAAFPVIAVALIALMLGNFLHGRAEFELLPASLVAFAASLLVIWLLGGTPLAFNGKLTVAVGESEWLSINAVLVWVVLLLVYVFHAARLPVWKLMRPRTFLTSLLLLVLLFIFYLALALDHPTLVAPEFHAVGSTSSALPWLFLILGPGALAGWQLLVIHFVTAREMRRETNARYVGYGAALLQGVIALTALLIAVTVVAPDAGQWAKLYATAPDATDFPRLLGYYIDGFARYAAVLRLDPLFARHLAATVIAGLALAVLESAARALKHLLAEMAPPPPQRPAEGERTRLWLIVLAGGLLALYDGRGLGGLVAWPLLALLSLWLAAAGFALMALALRAAARNALLAETLGIVVGLIALWSSLIQLWAWWETGAWIEFVVGLSVLLLAFSILREVARRRAGSVAGARA